MTEYVTTTRYEADKQIINERLDRDYKRLNALEDGQKAIGALNESLCRLDERFSHIETDTKEMKADIKGLLTKPSKKWDDLMDKLLWLVLGGVLTYVLTAVLTNMGG